MNFIRQGSILKIYIAYNIYIKTHTHSLFFFNSRAIQKLIFKKHLSSSGILIEFCMHQNCLSFRNLLTHKSPNPIRKGLKHWFEEALIGRKADFNTQRRDAEPPRPSSRPPSFKMPLGLRQKVGRGVNATAVNASLLLTTLQRCLLLKVAALETGQSAQVLGRPSRIFLTASWAR